MKPARPTNQANKFVRRVTTRNQNVNTNTNTNNKIPQRIDESSKRKAEISPEKKEPMKRSALGDLTNAAVGKKNEQDAKILLTKALVSRNVYRIKPSTVSNQTTKVQPVIKTKGTIKNLPVPSKPKIQVKAKPDANRTKSSVPDAISRERSSVPESVAKIIEVSKLPEEPSSLTEKPEPEEITVKCSVLDTEPVVTEKETKTQRSSIASEDRSGDSSLYVSALEDISDANLTKKEVQSSVQKIKRRSDIRRVPSDVKDFDEENIHDPFQVSIYAMDIFNYMKTREAKFVIQDYMSRQICISPWMRALLVDWMVEVQETFELNHETLYLGVKLVDHYLSKVTVGKETLQLLGAAALFIASKFDERLPPLVDDFIYICDGAYTNKELLRMECNLLKIVDFDLGIPLSYRFLRRYARCARLDLQLLTLARYILETSLMDYNFVTVSDSKLASAALLLALKMKNISDWTPTLEFYTGYKLEDFKDLVYLLNSMLHKKPKEALKTIRSKYSHKIFFHVAQTPLIQDLDL